MPQVPKFSEDELRAAVAASTTLTGTLRALGMRAAGGNFGTINKWIAVWGIPTDHFDADAARAGGPAPVPLEEVLVEHSTYSRRRVKERLYATGLKARACEQCGQGEDWNGRTMALILDHINGVADDNRLENLQIVCPNCAATLDTHCGRNIPTTGRSARGCARCDASFVPRSAAQRYCSTACGSRHDNRVRHPRPETRRAQRPPYEELVARIAGEGYEAVGRPHGVSGNAVRKWVRSYERERAAAVAVASEPTVVVEEAAVPAELSARVGGTVPPADDTAPDGGDATPAAEIGLAGEAPRLLP